MYIYNGIIVLMLLLNSINMFSQNSALLVDKVWNVQEYFTETVNGKSILFNIDVEENINDLNGSSFKFDSNGNYDAIVKKEVNSTGAWSLSTLSDSLEIEGTKYKIDLLTEDSLVLKNSGNVFGLELTSVLKLKEAEEVVLSIQDEIAENHLIEVYPNPVINNIDIKINQGVNKIKSLDLYSIDGVKIQTFLVKNKKDLKISMNELPSGIYFIKTPDLKIYKKLIKL